MSESNDHVNITVQRFALLTCIVALLPITVGALVTTLKAGMAFADWPTSDGQNMLLYPWLRDLRHTDKFVEHGHRLAGVLIGLVSTALVVVTFRNERRLWVRVGSAGILVAVIAQGLLGGMRVRMDQQVLAMTHSITGGLFFTLCFVFSLFVRRRGPAGCSVQPKVSAASFILGIVFPFVVLSQYVLGGFFRHLGQMLHEHIAGAILVSLLGLTALVCFWRSHSLSLRSRSRWLASALLIQVCLGLGSWVTKMGLPAFGWVATVNSPAQNITCSLHTVGGMFLLASATALSAELISLARNGAIDGLSDVFGSDRVISAGGTKEGLA